MKSTLKSTYYSARSAAAALKISPGEVAAYAGKLNLPRSSRSYVIDQSGLKRIASAHLADTRKEIESLTGKLFDAYRDIARLSAANGIRDVNLLRIGELCKQPKPGDKLPFEVQAKMVHAAAQLLQKARVA